MLDRLLELMHRHLHRLHGSDDVGELQRNEAQVPVFGELEGAGEVLDGHECS